MMLKQTVGAVGLKGGLGRMRASEVPIRWPGSLTGNCRVPLFSAHDC
jgi:hypothetical protein